MNTSPDPSIPSPPPASQKPSLYPPEPTHNPSIAPPFSKPPSFESMTSTLLQPTASEQDAATTTRNTTTHPPPQRPTLSSEYSSTHPFSAFYSHPTTRTSLEQAKSASKLNIHVYEHDGGDLESQTPLTTTNTSTTNTEHNHHLHTQHHDGTSPTTTAYSTPEKPKRARHQKRISTMWLSIPRCAAKTGTRGSSSKKRHNITGTVRGSRACAPYRRLSRGQKWVVQILLAVVVVGAATALGVGISKAVGAGVWKSDTSTAPIGDVR